MSSEKLLVIVPRELHRTRRFIREKHLHGENEFKIKSNEQPRPELNTALDALRPVLTTILQVAANWGDDVRITGVSFGELRDANTVAIHFQKPLTLSGKVLHTATPPVLLGTPKTEGAVTEPLAKEHVELVETVREEAREYALGKRGQGTLALDGADGADGEDGEDDADQREEDDPNQGKLEGVGAGAEEER